MLNKISENVLKSIIHKCDKVDGSVKISPKEIGISYSLFNSIAEDLRQNQLIHSFSFCYKETDYSEVDLTYKGYSYFEYQKLENKERLRNSMLVPIIVTLLTEFVVFLSKQALPYVPKLINIICNK